MTPKPLLVAYDISSDKNRRKIFRILQEWRLDGQKSVHECLLDRSKAEELFIQLGTALDGKTDALLMAWVDGRRKIMARGKGRTDAMMAGFRTVSG